jgi:hypothetical protein
MECIRAITQKYKSEVEYDNVEYEKLNEELNVLAQEFEE